MPSLVLFGKPTFLAGDDLRMFSITGMTFRLIQIVMTIIIMVIWASESYWLRWKNIRAWCYYDQDEDGNLYNPGDLNPFIDNAGAHIWTYLILSLGQAVIGLVWSLSMFVFTGRGTPTWTEPREKPLKCLCGFHLIAFNMLRIATCFWGVIAVLLVDAYCTCGRQPLPYGEGTFTSPDIKASCGDNYSAVTSSFLGLLVTHMIDAIVVGLSGVYFVCKCIPLKQIATKLLFLNRERRWKLCCRVCFANLSCLTCCLYGGREAMRGDLSDFAMLMSNFFSHEDYLDVTASDTFASLLMVKRSHLQDEMEAKKRFCERHLQVEEKKQSTSNDTDAEEQANPEPRRKSHYESLKKIYASTAHFTLGMLTSHQGIREAEKSTQNWMTGTSLSYIVESANEDDDDDENDVVDVDIEAPPSATATTPSVNEPNVRNRRSSRWLAPRFRSTLNVRDDSQLLVIAEGARFIHHAEAIYFWAAVKERRITPRIARRIKEVQSTADSLLLDRARQATGLASIPGVNPRDLLYIQNSQSITKTPYVVVVDHEWRSVVVSIRGSVSLEDLLTDLSLRPAELDDAGELHGFQGKGRYCHRGVLSRVNWIYKDLQENCNLHPLLEGEHAKFEGYRLRITGHSLGAAVASLLTLFLRDEFPQVRCLAFSPPGCTVCGKLSAEMGSFVTSYILDTDVIGRTSMEAFLGLRDELLEMVARIKIPKYKLLSAGRKEKGRVVPLDEYNRRALCASSEIDHTNEYVKKLDKFYEFEKASRQNFPKLYPPGRIIQLFRTINLPNSGGGCGCCCGAPQADSRVDQLEDIPYTARWAEREDFSRMILSSHFLSDHETANVKGQLHLLAEQAGLKEPWSEVLGFDLEVEA